MIVLTKLQFSRIFNLSFKWSKSLSYTSVLYLFTDIFCSTCKCLRVKSHKNFHCNQKNFSVRKPDFSLFWKHFLAILENPKCVGISRLSCSHFYWLCVCCIIFVVYRYFCKPSFSFSVASEINVYLKVMLFWKRERELHYFSNWRLMILPTIFYNALRSIWHHYFCGWKQYKFI